MLSNVQTEPGTLHCRVVSRIVLVGILLQLIVFSRIVDGVLHTLMVNRRDSTIFIIHMDFRRRHHLPVLFNGVVSADLDLPFFSRLMSGGFFGVDPFLARSTSFERCFSDLRFVLFCEAPVRLCKKLKRMADKFSVYELLETHKTITTVTFSKRKIRRLWQSLSPLA